MTRWQEFRAALCCLVTAYCERWAWNLVVLAMWLHPGLPHELVRMARFSAMLPMGDKRVRDGHGRND